jgi:hypothetical protein
LARLLFLISLLVFAVLVGLAVLVVVRRTLRLDASADSEPIQNAESEP